MSDSNTKNSDETTKRRNFIAATAAIVAGGATFAAPSAKSSTKSGARQDKGKLIVNESNLPEQGKPSNTLDVSYEDGKKLSEFRSSFVDDFTEIEGKAKSDLGKLNYAFDYPLNRVEYLLQTLREHVDAALELRWKIQELERQELLERYTLELESELLSVRKEEANLLDEYDYLKLNELIDATIEGSSISGAAKDHPYYKQANMIRNGLVSARVNHHSQRLGMVTSKDSLQKRAAAIKKLLKLEVNEAYSRAISVNLSLKTLFGYSKENVPNPTEDGVGYIDRLALWVRAVSYWLEKRLLQRRESLVYIPLKQIVARDKVGVASSKKYEELLRKAQPFVFRVGATEEKKSAVYGEKYQNVGVKNLVPPHLQGIFERNPRIVGLEVVLEQKTRNIKGMTSVNVELEDTEFQPNDLKLPDPAIRHSHSEFMRIRNRTSSPANIPLNTTFLNADPNRDWKITFPKWNNAGRAHAGNFEQIALWLRLSHD